MSVSFFKDRIGAGQASAKTPAQRAQGHLTDRGVSPVTPEMLKEFGMDDQDVAPYKLIKTVAGMKEAMVKQLLHGYELHHPISKVMESDPPAAHKKIASMIHYLEGLSGHHYVMAPDYLAEDILEEVHKRRLEGDAAARGKGKGPEMMEIEGVPPLTFQDFYYLKTPSSQVGSEMTSDQFVRAVRNLMLVKLPAMTAMPKPLAEKEKEWRESVGELADKEREDIIIKLLVQVRSAKIKAHGKLAESEMRWLGGVHSKGKGTEAQTRKKLGEEVREVARGYVKELKKYSETPQMIVMDMGEAQREIKKISEQLSPLTRSLEKQGEELRKEIRSYESIEAPDFSDLNETASSIKDILKSVTDPVTRIVVMDLMRPEYIDRPDDLKKVYETDMKKAQDVVKEAQAKGKETVTRDMDPGATEGTKIRVHDDLQTYKDIVSGNKKKIEALGKVQTNKEAMKELQRLAGSYYKAQSDLERTTLEEKFDFPKLQEFIDDTKAYFTYIKDMFERPGLRGKAKILWQGGQSALDRTTDRSDIIVPEEVTSYIGDIKGLTEELGSQVRRMSKSGDGPEGYEELSTLEHVIDFITKSPIVKWMDKKVFDMATGARHNVQGASWEEMKKLMVSLSEKVTGFLNKMDVGKAQTKTRNSLNKSRHLDTLVGKMYVKSQRSDIYEHLSDMLRQIDQPSSTISLSDVAAEMKSIAPKIKELGSDLDSDSMMATVMMSFERRKEREAKLDPMMKDIKAKGLVDAAALSAATSAVKRVFGMTDDKKAGSIAKRYLSEYKIPYSAPKKSKSAMLWRVAGRLREMVAKVDPKDVGWGYYQERMKSVGKQPKKTQLRSFFESQDQLKSFVDEINKRSDDFRKAVMMGDDTGAREQATNIDEAVAKVMMVREKNLRDTLLSNATISKESDKNLDEAQKTLARNKVLAQKAGQEIEAVRQHYVPKLTELVSFMKDPKTYVEESVKDKDVADTEDFRKTQEEISSISESDRQLIKKHQQELNDARKYMKGRYITKKELMHVMSKYVHPKSYTDEEYEAQMAKLQKSGPEQVKEIFDKMLDSVQIENWSRERIQKIRAALESVYRSDPVRFDYDPEEYRRMIEHLEQIIARKTEALEREGVDLKKIEDQYREDAKSLPEDEVRDVNSILNFSDEKIKFGIRALLEMKRELATLKGMHEDLKEEAPSKEKAIREEYDALLKSFDEEVGQDKINKVLAGMTSLAAKAKPGMSFEQQKQMRDYMTDVADPMEKAIQKYLTSLRETGAIKAMIRRLEIVKFMDPAENKKMQDTLKDLLEKFKKTSSTYSGVYTKFRNKVPRSKEHENFYNKKVSIEETVIDPSIRVMGSIYNTLNLTEPASKKLSDTSEDVVLTQRNKRISDGVVSAEQKKDMIDKYLSSTDKDSLPSYRAYVDGLDIYPKEKEELKENSQKLEKELADLRAQLEKAIQDVKKEGEQDADLRDQLEKAITLKTYQDRLQKDIDTATIEKSKTEVGKLIGMISRYKEGDWTQNKQDYRTSVAHQSLVKLDGLLKSLQGDAQGIIKISQDLKRDTAQYGKTDPTKGLDALISFGKQLDKIRFDIVGVMNKGADALDKGLDAQEAALSTIGVKQDPKFMKLKFDPSAVAPASKQVVAPQIKAPTTTELPTLSPKAPGVAKTAAFKVRDPGGTGDYDPTQDIASPEYEEPEDIDVASPEMGDEVQYDVRDWKLAEALFEKNKDDIRTWLGKMDKEQDPKEKIAIANILTKLRDQMRRLGGYLDLSVNVGGETIKAKEAPQRFQDMYDEYRERMFKARRNQEDALDQIQKMHNKIRSQTAYKVHGLGEVEKSGIMKSYLQSLYWYLTQLWSKKVGQQTQFGSKTEAPFSKVYEAMANFADVKTNPIYQSVIKNAEQIMDYGLGDRKSDKSLSSLLQQKKKIEQWAMDQGYGKVEGTKKNSPEKAREWLSENVNAYREIEKMLEYFKRLKKEKENIFEMMHKDIDKEFQKKVLTSIMEKSQKLPEESQDKGLIALITKKIADLEAETKEALSEIAQKVEPLPQEITKDILYDAEKVIEDAEKIGAASTMKKSKKTQVKQAYDKTHPDFDLKWLYHPLMKKKIAEMTSIV